VLVGVPGSGKSTVGRALAERLGVGFRDTDADVERATGRTIAEIFIESGEPEFRRLEAAAVARALVEHQGVLALGGGAVMDPGTRADLADHPVAWLRVGLAAASQRAGLGVARPVLLGSVRAQMKALMDARAPLYAQVARAVVDTDRLTVPQTVEALLAALGLAGEGGSGSRAGGSGPGEGGSGPGEGGSGPAGGSGPHPLADHEEAQ
jgi:shikimate kinase